MSTNSSKRWVLLEQGLFSKFEIPMKRFKPIKAIYKEKPLIAFVQAVPIYATDCSLTLEVELLENIVGENTSGDNFQVGKKWEVMVQGKFDKMRDTLGSGHCGWEMDFRQDVHQDFIESTNKIVRSQDFESLYYQFLKLLRDSQNKIEDAAALIQREQRKKNTETVQPEPKILPKMVHPQWLPTIDARPVYEEEGRYFHYEQGHRIYISKHDSASLINSVGFINLFNESINNSR